MRSFDMNEKQIKALIKSIERIVGNPIEADAREVDALFAEFGDGKARSQSVFDLVSRAAQKYRLEGKAVPIHVTEALNSARRGVSGESLETADTDSVIDSVLNPILGPVQEVSYAFRNRKERTPKDTDLLEKLSGDVKRDWSEDKEK
jgi:hypothetical protein